MHIRDIKIELTNPLVDWTLDAKTDLGSLKSKREDLSLKGEQIKFGSGPLKVNLKTNFGNVIIW